jgi:hypothetical protein
MGWTGVDLEAKQTNGVRAGGPNGDLDVYHDFANSITANGSDLYPDKVRRRTLPPGARRPWRRRLAGVLATAR